MYRPFLSYSLAFFVYCCFVLFGFNFNKNQTYQPQISLEIDTQISNSQPKNNPHQHELSKQIAKKSIANLHDKNHVESDEDFNKKKNQLPNNQINKNIVNNSKPLYQPLPEIPDDLRYEAMQTNALAKFYIDETGAVTKVELLKPSNSLKLNYLLLENLKQWRFPANNQSSTQEININFKVK
jgi:TonB family protein